MISYRKGIAKESLYMRILRLLGRLILILSIELGYPMMCQIETGRTSLNDERKHPLNGHVAHIFRGRGFRSGKYTWELKP